MLGWTHLFPNAATAAHVFFEVVAILLVPVVLLRRKEASSTAAWILTLVFLPALGIALFLLFGRDRVRWPARRKRTTDAIVRAAVGAIRGEEIKAKATPHTSFPDEATELEELLFRMASHLTHQAASGSNRVQVLGEGDRVYDALGAAIDAAEHHVHAEFYLIRDDKTGRWFRERLVQAALRGVEVRLLCDGYGCFMLGPRWIRPILAAGGKARFFFPMQTILFQPVNLRNHRKIVVVDGKTAFTGGVNVGDEYRGQMPGVGKWREVHLQIDGAAAADLQRVFLQDWSFAANELVTASSYFPKPEATGKGYVAVVPSGPDTRTEAIHRLFIGAIGGAHNKVILSTPYFVPDQAMLVSLEVAALRGVDVRMILPSRSNHKVTFHAGRSFYEPLLEAGVHIYEYQPGIVHAKTMVVDERVCLVGSANMDLRSFRLNFEVHTLIHDSETATQLTALFEGNLAMSKPVSAQAWSARPRSLRVLEGASRLVSPLL